MRSAGSSIYGDLGNVHVDSSDSSDSDDRDDRDLQQQSQRDQDDRRQQSLSRKESEDGAPPRAAAGEDGRPSAEELKEFMSSIDWLISSQGSRASKGVFVSWCCCRGLLT